MAMQQVNMCTFYDLLKYCETTRGIPYNKAHDMFVEAGKCSGEIYVLDMVGELEGYRGQLSENEIIVYECIVEFAKLSEVDEFYIEPKNW